MQPTGFCRTCGWHRIDHAMSAGGIGHPQKENEMEQVWYHVPPKRANHAPRPQQPVADRVGAKGRCVVCQGAIQRQPDNAGPESLASMFRL
jgi:hypothetical protein